MSYAVKLFLSKEGHVVMAIQSTPADTSLRYRLPYPGEFLTVQSVAHQSSLSTATNSI